MTYWTDVLVVWEARPLGRRNLAHLIKHRAGPVPRGVALRVLAGQGAQVDTTTAARHNQVDRRDQPRQQEQTDDGE